MVNIYNTRINPDGVLVEDVEDEYTCVILWEIFGRRFEPPGHAFPFGGN